METYNQVLRYTTRYNDMYMSLYSEKSGILNANVLRCARPGLPATAHVQSTCVYESRLHFSARYM